MVFESIVTELLNKFLGSYVQNLDSSQLKLGIWGGDAVLQNLILKENALNELDLPVKTTYGSLGKLVLKIPWKNLYNAPVVASIENLQLLVVPNTEVKYNAEKEEKIAWETKQALIKKLEEAKRIEEERKKPRDPQQDTFTEKLVTQVIKNLQINIKDIHVRFEDKLSHPGNPFAFGLTLHTLTFESTDENWKVGLVQDANVKIIYKLVTLNNCAVYWNSKTKLFSEMDDKERGHAFMNGISTDTYTPQNVNAVLGPINSSLKLQLNSKPEQTVPEFSIPKILMSLVMDELSFAISKYQYQDILILSQSVEWMVISSRYRKYRPEGPVLGNAKAWWHFAFKCIVEEDVKRVAQNWSWSHIKTHRDTCRSYKEMYMQVLMGKRTSTDNLMQNLEKDLDIFNITLVRRQADLEFERSGLKKEEAKSTGWFGGWFGKKKDKKEETSIVKQFEDAMSPEEKAKLCEAIGYSENMTPAVYPKTFIENEVRFHLKKLRIKIVDDAAAAKIDVLQLILVDVNSTIEQRPAANAIKVAATVGTLTVTGYKSEALGEVPAVVSTKSTDAGSKSLLLSFLFETTPLDCSCDQRLHVKSNPLEIVYNAETINSLATFFKPPKDVEIYSKLQVAAANTFSDLKEYSATSYQYAIDMHKYLDLQLDMKGPYLIVPEKGVYQKNVPLLLIDMGNLKMSSIKREQSGSDGGVVSLSTLSKMGASQDEIMKEMQSQVYDKYILSFSGIQILFASMGDDWMLARQKSKTSLHIWQPTNIEIQVDKSVIMDDPRLPKLKVHGSLPHLHFNLSDLKVLRLAKLIFSIPPPPSAPEEEVVVVMEPQLTADSLRKLNVDSAKKLNLEDGKSLKQKKPAHKEDIDPAKLVEAQSTNLEFSFELGEVSLTISKRDDTKDVDFMKFSINKLGVDMKARSYDTVINVYLGGIAIVNTEYAAIDGGPVYLIHAPRAAKSADMRLCTIQLQLADKKSPVFASYYGRVCQQINVNFTELKVLLHQEAILSSVKFAKDLAAELEKVQPPPRPSTPVRRTDSVKSLAGSIFGGSAMEKQLRSSTQKIFSRRRKKEEDVDLKLVAQLDTLALSIGTNERTVLDIKVGGIKADVILQKSMTSVHNVLGNITILDPTPDAVHSQILSVVGKEVIDTKIVIHNSATMGDDYLNMTKCDMSVVASIGGVRIIFVNKLVTDLMNFASNFQVAVDKVKASAAKAAEAAMENVQSAFEKASRICLKVQLKAPEIIMPRNSKSLDVLLLDMGQLNVENKFSLGKTTLKEFPSPPILETLSIKLQDFKMSRAIWDNKKNKLKAECALLKPMVIGLTIKRNLSASWCTDIPQIDINGKLGLLILTISQEDYSSIMKTLNENLSEQPVSDLREIDITMLELAVAEPVVKDRLPLPEGPKKNLAVLPEEPEDAVVMSNVYTTFKFYFALDKLSATLYSGSSNLTTGVTNRNPANALAKFELHVVAVKGEMFSDQGIYANVVLVNCILDDIRESQKTFVTRLMERSDTDSHNMIDVTFKKDATLDIYLDVKVYSFSLVACPDYLMMISHFFAIEDDNSKPKEVKKTKSNVNQEAPPSEPPKFSTSISLRIEKPDIMLLDDITNINTYGIMLNMEATVRLKTTPEKQTIFGSIDGLQILSCCFNPEFRAGSITEILSPCIVSLSSSMPTGEGMHVDLDIGDIELHMTPASVRLLTSISSKFATPPSLAESAESVQVDYSDLWVVQQLKNMNYWYLKPEEGVEAVEEVAVVATSIRNEQMIIRAKTILMTLEIGVGAQAVPMLLLELSFFANMLNWSKAVEINGGLSLEMLCFNEKLALWEPFIERVETGKGGMRPWELILELKMNNDPIRNTEQEAEEMIFEIPKSTLLVKSQDVMDIVISKTSLEVLTNLGQSFSDAVNLAPTKQIEGPTSPYLIENYTGFAVTLVMTHEDFQVVGSEHTEEIKEVVLESNATVPLTIKMDSGVRGKKSVLKQQEMANDYKLIVKFNDMNAVRQMSVKKADKRLFPLPQKTYPGDQWGIVCDVRAVYGTKVVTLRSPVQVYNDFHNPIEVYYMSQTKEDELVCCGIAQPRKMLNLPFPAVYTATNELFFRPQNDEHKFSVTPYTWKDLVKNPTFHKVLPCESKQLNGRPFNIHVIGQIDQVYFEDTKKKTLASTCYVLNLKPTVLLKNFLPIPLSYSRQGEVKEEEVESGGKIELYWAEVNTTTLTLGIKDYLSQTWTCSRKLESKVDELSVWSFESNATTTLKNTMELGMYTENDYNSLTIALYCPFWMINKTGLPLAYKAEETSITTHPVNHVGPILFSFKAKHFFARKKTCLKIQETEWSDKFSIDVVGSSGTVKCRTKEGFSYEVGVEIRLSNFRLSKIVTFTPYYLLINNCNFDVDCSENPANHWMTIPTNQCLPFWPKQSKPNEMKLRIKESADESSDESKPFLYNDQHTTLLMFNNQFGGVQVDCQVNEASVIMSFTAYKRGMASVRLVNHLPATTITCHQTGEKDMYSLAPGETTLYTWDNPLGKRELLWSPEKKEYKNDLVKDGIGEFKTEKEDLGYWVSFLDDTQRTLLFTDDIALATRTQFATEFERIEQEINIHIQGFGVSLVDNFLTREVIYLSIASSGVVWEICKEKSRRFKAMPINMSHVLETAYQKYVTDVKMGQTPNPRQLLEQKIEVDFNEGKLYKPNKRKIRRSFHPGLWIMYKTAPHRLQVHAKINKLQIDNQMPDCIFPVVLAPIPPPKTVAADSEPKPFTEVSIMMRKSDYSSIQQYQYFKILIQEFHIKVDQSFIGGILSMFTMEELKQDEKDLVEKDMESLQIELRDIAMRQVDQDKENFYDLLHFSPLKVHVSFSNQGCSGDGKKSNPLAANFLNLFVQSVGVTLTEIQDVVFKLAYFERQHKFMSQKQLTGEVITHYCGQAIKQMYVLVLGLDVIGNPFGLVIGLRQGVEDLFYEPIQGAIQGPEEFAEGLALGVKSLFGHAVGGAAGAVSRITGTLGKGIAALTLDEDYKRKRREAQLQRSANFQEGMAQSGKGLVMGVFDGVTGVFVKPIEGAKEEGVEGFLKGVGKGVVGLVTRPTAGVIDFASGTLDSVKRIADSSTEATRVRPPRFFQSDNIIRPYNKHEAEGNKLLQDVEKGKFASTDVYKSHTLISVDGKLVILITDKRIACVSKGEIFGQWNCDWQIPWEDVKGVPKVTDKGVAIHLKEPKKKVFGMFGSGDNTRVIHVKTKEVGQWIVEKIEEARQSQI